MIDATIRPLPSGFTSVFFDLPSENQPVLAIRLSGYSCATFGLMTARYMPTYRPRSPWRAISTDAVSDSGRDTLGLREAADWIGPVRSLHPSIVRYGCPPFPRARVDHP